MYKLTVVLVKPYDLSKCDQEIFSRVNLVFVCLIINELILAMQLHNESEKKKLKLLSFDVGPE